MKTAPEAERGSAASPAFLRRCTDTCPGNAPVQPSLATGLVQGQERPLQAEPAETMHRWSRKDRHHESLEGGEGQQRPAGRWAGAQGSQLSTLLEWILGRECIPPPREQSSASELLCGQRVA